MAEIRYLLDETIETELQNLKSFNGDGKERSAAIDDIVALYKLHIDEIKRRLTRKKSVNAGLWSALGRRMSVRTMTGKKHTSSVSSKSRVSIGM